MKDCKKITLYVLILIISSTLLYLFGRSIWEPVYLKFTGRRTVQEVIDTIGPRTEIKLKDYFAKSKVHYPPEKLIFICYKKDRLFEVWASTGNSYTLVKTYKVLAASGKSGPKLRRGDLQVPEGLYRITGLNPNSRFHLSLKINYPNPFDTQMANQGGRDNLGGDIFIHGSSFSIGCIAIGNSAIEEIFVLSEKIKKENIEMIISPNKHLQYYMNNLPGDSPSWVKVLYKQIYDEIINNKLYSN